MRRSLLVAAAITPLFFVSATEAAAQYRFGGGGFRAGGFHGGGFYGRGIGVRSYGVRTAYPGWRGGWGAGVGWRGAGFYPRRAYYRGGYYPYRRYWGGGSYPYWGLASGLATAAVIGAATAYPAYDYPAYDYPAYDYPAYPAYEAVLTASGGQCSTPVKICTLYEPAPLGVGCSCRVPGGRAYGSVVGP